MNFQFNTIIDRRGTCSMKWDKFPPDILPLWVADTDFAVAEPIIKAMKKRLEHPILGYSGDDPLLLETVQNRMKEKYQWEIKTEDIVLVPGIVAGFNYVCRATCQTGDSVLFHVPAYPPFFGAPANNGLETVTNALVYNPDTNLYEIDFEQFEKDIQNNTRLFILCNPQNPTGRVFTREELTKMGEICAKHDILICSDEIHSDIIFSGHHHIPIASLNQDLAQRTVTLIAPSKTFNIPGMSCSFAIIQNPDLRAKFRKALQGFSSFVTPLSQAAGLAAYAECSEWLYAMNRYLETNRNFLTQFVQHEMPEIQIPHIQATFLAWMNCSASPIHENPQNFFEKEAKVGLNDGSTFGKEYEKFVRLNFGTPRPTLEEALERMKKAYQKLS